MVLVTVFTGFNLDNKCNIWLFYTFKNVPVFLTILVSFVFGVLVTLPFTLKNGNEKNRKSEKKSKSVLKDDKKSSVSEEENVKKRPSYSEEKDELPLEK